MGPTHDGKERLVKLAVRAQYELNLPGNLCADAPPTSTFEELERLAQDREAWRQHWESIAPSTTPYNSNNDEKPPKHKKKRRLQKPKLNTWTDEQRQSWARAYYREHHAEIDVNWENGSRSKRGRGTSTDTPPHTHHHP